MKLNLLLVLVTAFFSAPAFSRDQSQSDESRYCRIYEAKSHELRGQIYFKPGFKDLVMANGETEWREVRPNDLVTRFQKEGISYSAGNGDVTIMTLPQPTAVGATKPNSGPQVLARYKLEGVPCANFATKATQDLLMDQVFDMALRKRKVPQEVSDLSLDPPKASENSSPKSPAKSPQ